MVYDGVSDESTVHYWAHEAQKNVKTNWTKDHPCHPKLQRSAEIHADINKKIY